jgi:hypothetical protein
MPDTLKAGIEHLSGIAMDDVRVHYNSSRPAQVQALAYTQGSEIYVAPGQERHWPHEAWHVVQQKQGRVRPTLQFRGVAINTDGGLEQEAESMGAAALQPGQAAQTKQLQKIPSARRDVVQLATSFRFADTVTGNSRITAAQHDRAGVNQQAWEWVLTYCAWQQVPGGTVCNHSRSYNEMAQTRLDAIHNETLSFAAEFVTDIHTELVGHHKGLDNSSHKYQGYKRKMSDLVHDPCDTVDADETVDTFNYFIYKICDYPANLFYWPDRTGANPDEPQGLYGHNFAGPYWMMRDPTRTDMQRLQDERQRLADARGELYSAMP